MFFKLGQDFAFVGKWLTQNSFKKLSLKVSLNKIYHCLQGTNSDRLKLKICCGLPVLDHLNIFLALEKTDCETITQTILYFTMNFSLAFYSH